MRNGYRIFDADTHIKPSAESVRPYLAKSVLERIPDLDEHLTPIRTGMAGEQYEAPFRHLFRFAESAGGWSSGKPRYLGETGPRTDVKRQFQTFMGSRLPTDGGGDFDANVRLKDMDEEGSDVHFIVHTAGAGHPDPELEREFVRAEHRYMDNFCGADPSRLKSCITVSPKDIELSLEEIKTYGASRWAVAIHPTLPLDYPIDHPDLKPVWKAACDHNLAVIHHSFGSGYPGYRDLWQNPFLGRLAGHPWGAMRAVATFFGSGLMDQFPTIRYGILESGFGWLPFWGKRMDDQVVYMGYVNENLQHKMSDYLTGGRFFAATVLHEGEDMVRMVTDQLGDDLLMFGSDYPHSESRFPESVDVALGWERLSKAERQKMLWDKPIRFFGEP